MYEMKKNAQSLQAYTQPSRYRAVGFGRYERGGAVLELDRLSPHDGSYRHQHRALWESYVLSPFIGILNYVPTVPSAHRGRPGGASLVPLTACYRQLIMRLSSD